jgi:hypothetical protein
MIINELIYISHKPRNKYAVTLRLKAGIVAPKETFVARQRLGKHIAAAKNTQATIEGLLGNDVFCWVRPEASRRKRQKGRSQI